MNWFTAAELADMALADLPGSTRGVKLRASEEAWAERRNLRGEALSRVRAGRGAPTEYHYSVLPPRAQAALIARGHVRDEAVAAEQDRGERQRRFDALPEKDKQTARDRLAVLDKVRALQRGGMTKSAAVAQAAMEAKASPSTVYSWMTRIYGLRADARLAALAPRPRGRAEPKPIPGEAWELLKADYLRPERPSFESCAERLEAIAAERGWQLPSRRTLKRRIESEIPEHVRVLKREGREALESLYPTQMRDRSSFHALEAVNADGHRFDVFVKWPDGKVARPTMVAIQDLYSNKIVGWRIGQTESADLVRLAFGDVFANWGIPDHVWLDNGRGFASKWISGGTPTRYRFKVRDEDPVGALTALGVRIHWTRPYSGRSKPIERAFRDLCDRAAKHPAFAGAWTGNRPDAKPENYASAAVPLGRFREIVAEEIAQHNARPGRKTGACRGALSFDQAFNESYAAAPIQRASAAQLRHCLLAAEAISADRKTGAVTLFGNRYWSEPLISVRGQKVIVRFDPDALHIPVHVYRMDGGHVAEAARWEATGFDDAAAAREHARNVGAFRRAARALAEAEVRLKPQDVAAALPGASAAETPAPTVVRLATVAGERIVAGQPAADTDSENAKESFEDRWMRAAEKLG